MVRRRLDIDAPMVAASGSTAAAAAVAAIALVLSDHGADDAAEFGVVMSTRDHPRLADLTGTFVGTVPISLDPTAARRGSDLLASATAALGEALARRSTPLGDLTATARAIGAPPPEVRVLFAHERWAPMPLPGVAEVRSVLPAAAVAELTFFLHEHADGSLELAAEYRGSAVSRSAAAALLDAAAAAFARLVGEPSASVDSFRTEGEDLVGDPLVATGGDVDEDDVGRDDAGGAEVSGELGGVGRVGVVDLRDRIVHHLDRGPDQPAVVDRVGGRLSRADLDRRADRIAEAVIDRLGGRRPARRGGAIDRRVDLVAAMLAAWRLGAAYVPLDPSTPRARLDQILDAADCDVVVATADTPAVVGDDRPLVLIDSIDEHGAAGDLARTTAQALAGQSVASPDDPAYVIFTSGSTGRPRGVEVRHGQLAASTAARDVWFSGSPDRFLVTSSAGFDSSIVGLWWTLATGGTVLLPSDEDVHDVDRLADVIATEAVTHTLMVPSLWAALLERGDGALGPVRVAIVAGEACPPQLVRRHHELLGAELVNEYGPTEATVWATVHRLEPTDRTAPIGRPIPGARVRVAGPSGRARPAGVAGELWIAGPGVTDGYLDDPEATGARFVLCDGLRWYRTGDLVRDVDGVLHFLGRLDDQLNVGGVRVEPDEVERVLRSAPNVADAVVVAAGEPPALVAHVVSDGEAIDPVQVRRWVAERLPAAMTPARVVEQPALPRTVHGKLDRAGAADLPDRSRVETDPKRVRPTGVVGEVVAAWESVFDRQVDPDDDFFDLGGDSLAAVTLVTDLAGRFDRRVPIAAVLQGRTPAGLAALLGDDIGGDGGGEGGGDAGVASDRVTGDERPRPEPGAVGARTVDQIQVVRFRSAPPGSPLVLLTASWDEVFGYQALSDALPGGVEAVALGHDHEAPSAATSPITEVDDYVDRTVEALAAVDLDRPIVIVGWSIGGVVAMELAARLSANGTPVSAVGLVDTFFPGEEQHLWSNRWWKYRSLLTPRALGEWRIEIAALLRRRIGRLTSAIRRRVRPSPPADPGTSSGAPPDAVVRRIGSFPADAFAHEPSRVTVPVVFFAASGSNPKRTHRRWREVADDLRVVPVQGRHRGFESLMGAERVPHLVEGLRPFLGR
ncbi:MAG: amino acid adenylation domain-containing protein [Actinomycetota bacterium]